MRSWHWLYKRLDLLDKMNRQMKIMHFLIVFVIFVAQSARSGYRYSLSAQMKHRAVQNILQIVKRRKYLEREYHHFYDLFLLWMFHKLKFIPNKRRSVFGFIYCGNRATFFQMGGNDLPSYIMLQNIFISL